MTALVMRCVPAALLLFVAGPAAADRLKDLADIEGFRPNQLAGVGIVVGLAGTGDDATSTATRRPLATMMRHLGVTLDPGEIKARNAALVMVTASLPPFARPGMPLDVTISSVGTARSLQGGTLIATALKGADRQTYALAQGPLTVGGFDLGASSGAGARKNHVTVARIPGGGIVEHDAPSGLPKGEVVLLLREPDFTTASRIATAIRGALGERATATVRDPATVTVTPGAEFVGKIVDLVAALEAVEASPDLPARIIIDERTGTIVIGAGVSLSGAAIAHGGISIRVNERPTVSQPAPLSAGGQTTVVPDSEIAVEEKDGRVSPIPAATTVGDVAAALNALGVKPRDLVAILQALKAAGALHGEIHVL